MTNNLIIVFTSLCLLVHSTVQAAEIEHFQLPTRDGLTFLSGQIDFPEYPKDRFPLVIMVPGTGLFDRDAEFGNTGTHSDLIFKNISKELVESGFSVLRYDYRGVSCNSQTMPACIDCTDRQSRKKAMFEACIDNSLRASVTPENIRDDIELLFDYVGKHIQIHSDQIIAFGHSEGSLNLSHLIAQNRIQPRGVVFMGGMAESPKAAIEWQSVGRIVDTLFQLDINNDGVLYNSEIKNAHESSALKSFPVEHLLSPSGHWTKSTLRLSRESQYQAVLNEAISHQDDEPFGFGGVVQASYRWWKMFFTDDQSVAENLLEYPGRVIYIHGTNDFQVDHRRQRQILNEFEDDFLRKPEMILIENVGHTLGNDPVVGPIPKSSIDKIVEAVKMVAQ